MGRNREKRIQKGPEEWEGQAKGRDTGRKCEMLKGKDSGRSTGNQRNVKESEGKRKRKKTAREEMERSFDEGR